MTIDDVAMRVSEALNSAGVPYMLVGGFSSNYHGIPSALAFIVEQGTGFSV